MGAELSRWGVLWPASCFTCLFTLNSCLHTVWLFQRRKRYWLLLKVEMPVILEKPGSALRSLLSPTQGCICHATIRHKGILITESIEKPLETFTGLVLLRTVSHRVSLTGMINKLLKSLFLQHFLPVFSKSHRGPHETTNTVTREQQQAQSTNKENAKAGLHNPAWCAVSSDITNFFY